jgi:hypothetical protein
MMALGTRSPGAPPVSEASLGETQRGYVGQPGGAARGQSMTQSHIVVDLAMSRFCRLTAEGVLVMVVQTLLQWEQQQHGGPIDGKVIDELTVEIGNLIGAAPVQTLAAAFELRRRFAIAARQTERDWPA